MSSTSNDEEITYGPKKFGFNDLLSTLAFLAVGAAMIVWGSFDLPHRGYQMIFTGVLLIFLICLGTLYRLVGGRKNFPHVTMYATGISYALSQKATFEIRWDSVGPFQVSYDKLGNPQTIEASITGPNFSDNLKQSHRFCILSPTLLDVDARVLLEEINQVRHTSLLKLEKSNDEN